MGITTTVALNPGVATQVPLGPTVTRAVKASNTSPFDVQYYGFGTSGSHWIPAGTEYLIYDEGENSGTLNLLPFNNAGVSGSGNFLVTRYSSDEQVPTGTWPISIPTQIVQAKVTTITDLVNDGNVAGHQFIESKVGTDPTSVSVTNDANVIFGSTLHPGSLTVAGGSTFNGAVSAAAGGTGLTVANDEVLNGHLIMPNNKSIQMKNATGTPHDMLFASVTNQAVLQGIDPAGGIAVNDSTGAQVASWGAAAVTAAGMLLSQGFLDIANAGTQIAGSAGQITFITPIWGPSGLNPGFKLLIIYYSGYTNASATTFSLPSAMTHCAGIIGGLGGSGVTIQPKSGGLAVNPFAITALGGAAAGTIAGPLSNWHQGTLAILDASWDNLAISAMTTATGFIVLAGV